jgi:hypothetical protein
LPGIGLGIDDEFLRGLGGKVRPHQQHIGDCSHDRHRLELGGIEGDVLVEQRIDRERGRLRGEQRVAVRIGGKHRFRADIAGGTGAVLHHHRLAEALLQAIGDDARDGIDAAAGRNADDDPDRPVGIVGRVVLRGCGGHVKQTCGYQGQNCTHVVLPPPPPTEAMALKVWHRTVGRGNVAAPLQACALI